MKYTCNLRKLIKSIQYHTLKYHMKFQAVTTPDEKNGKERFTVKTFHVFACLDLRWLAWLI